MPDFHGIPTGKGGTGVRTEPAVVSYGDVLRVSSSGYEFGFGATSRSHAIAIWPMTKPVGPDTLVSNLEMPEISAGVYMLDASLLASGAFFDAVGGAGTLGAAPGLTILKDDGTNVVMLIESTLFSAENAWYLVGIVTLGTPGNLATIDNLVDFQVVYLQGADVPVISASALVGVDVDMLDRALALAGHNIRMNGVTFIDGRPSTRTLTGADKSLNAISTPALEDPDSAVGAGVLLVQTVTLTPDSSRNPDTDVSEDA